MAARSPGALESYSQAHRRLRTGAQSSSRLRSARDGLTACCTSCWNRCRLSSASGLPQRTCTWSVRPRCFSHKHRDGPVASRPAIDDSRTPLSSGRDGRSISAPGRKSMLFLTNRNRKLCATCAHRRHCEEERSDDEAIQSEAAIDAGFCLAPGPLHCGRLGSSPAKRRVDGRERTRLRSRPAASPSRIALPAVSPRDRSVPRAATVRERSNDNPSPLPHGRGSSWRFP